MSVFATSVNDPGSTATCLVKAVHRSFLPASSVKVGVSPSGRAVGISVLRCSNKGDGKPGD